MRNNAYQRFLSRQAFILCLIAFVSTNCVTAAGALDQLKEFVAHKHVCRVSRAGRILLFFDLLQLARTEQDRFFVLPVSQHRIALQVECSDLSKFSTLFFRWLIHSGSTLILSPVIHDRVLSGQPLLNIGFHAANCFLFSVSLSQQICDMLTRRYLQTISLRDLASRVEECPVCLGDESGLALVVPCEDDRHALCGNCYQRLVDDREFYSCLFCNRIVPVQIVVEAKPSICSRVNRLEGTERWLLVMLFAMQVHILFFLILDLLHVKGYIL